VELHGIVINAEDEPYARPALIDADMFVSNGVFVLSSVVFADDPHQGEE
jgi:hypothetical protein